MNEVLFTRETTEIKELLKQQIQINQDQLKATQENNELLIQLIEALADEGMIEEEQQSVTYLNSRG